MSIISLFLASFAAGFLGTIVMTIGQEIHIRITGRPVSYTPALAFFRLFRLDFNILSRRAKDVTNYAVHFFYGTVWGFPLAFLHLAQFTDFIQILAVYFLIVWIQGLVVVSTLGGASLPWTWGLKENLTKFFFNALYATASLSFFVMLFY